jgi:hypothetical protein
MRDPCRRPAAAKNNSDAVVRSADQIVCCTSIRQIGGAADTIRARDRKSLRRQPFLCLQGSCVRQARSQLGSIAAVNAASCLGNNFRVRLRQRIGRILPAFRHHPICGPRWAPAAAAHMMSTIRPYQSLCRRRDRCSDCPADRVPNRVEWARSARLPVTVVQAIVAAD